MSTPPLGQHGMRLPIARTTHRRNRCAHSQKKMGRQAFFRPREATRKIRPDCWLETNSDTARRLDVRLREVVRPGSAPHPKPLNLISGRDKLAFHSPGNSDSNFWPTSLRNRGARSQKSTRWCTGASRSKTCRDGACSLIFSMASNFSRLRSRENLRPSSTKPGPD